MNDMNETLAEIRRRGNERILARKQARNRVIALCVPLVLCVAAVLAMPEFGQPTNVSIPVETKIPAETQTHTLPSAQDNSAVLLTVTGKGINRSYTDKETFLQLQDLLNAVVVAGQGTASISEQSAAGTPSKITEKAEGLRLTVYVEEEPMEFILYSNAIFKEEENLFYGISTAQYNALLQLLELP